MLKIIFITTIALLFLIIPASASETGIDSPILPHRIYDTQAKTLMDFEGLLRRCADADVVTLGENHGDPATNRVELALLMGLARLIEGKVVLSMEMFERDIQDVVDEYLHSVIDEEEFLASSNPPAKYKTSYRPLVEYCKANGIPLIASNFPWTLGLKVGEMGYYAAVESFTEDERKLLPEIYDAPQDEYFKKHKQTIMSMGGHGGMEGITDEVALYYYQNQVLRDETMAESVYKASLKYPGSTIYHIVGSFHVEDYLGTYERIRKRMAEADLVSILVRPVDDILAASLDDIPGCDYVIFVIKEPEKVEGNS